MQRAPEHDTHDPYGGQPSALARDDGDQIAYRGPEKFKSGRGHAIMLAGRQVTIQGEESDGYFQAAQHHANAMAHLDAVLARIPDDAVIFDVGANIGLSAGYMAIRKPRARIYAFEPGPVTSRHLAANVVQFANVTSIAAAVSNERGELRFHQTSDASGAHVVGAGHMAPPDAVTVPCIRLDDFAAERGLSPALIKVDVEGHEPEALAGAAEMLATGRPLVHIEFNAWTLMAFGGHSPAAFAAALFRSFDVEGADSALAMLHNNLLRDGCVSDVTMRLKDGHTAPSLDEMSYPTKAIAELRRLSAT